MNKLTDWFKVTKLRADIADSSLKVEHARWAYLRFFGDEGNSEYSRNNLARDYKNLNAAWEKHQSILESIPNRLLYKSQELNAEKDRELLKLKTAKPVYQEAHKLMQPLLVSYEFGFGTTDAKLKNTLYAYRDKIVKSFDGEKYFDPVTNKFALGLINVWDRVQNTNTIVLDRATKEAEKHLKQFEKASDKVDSLRMDMNTNSDGEKYRKDFEKAYSNLHADVSAMIYRTESILQVPRTHHLRVDAKAVADLTTQLTALTNFREKIETQYNKLSHPVDFKQNIATPTQTPDAKHANYQLSAPAYSTQMSGEPQKPSMPTYSKEYTDAIEKLRKEQASNDDENKPPNPKSKPAW